MRFLKISLTAAAVALFSACGGGGDESPSPAYLVGTYNATFAKVEDSCFIGGPYNGAQHVVTAEGSSVGVQVNTLALRGKAREEGGLEAKYVLPANGATATATLIYSLPEGVASPGNGTFDSSLTIKSVASNGFTCTLRYVGSVSRVG